MPRDRYDSVVREKIGAYLKTVFEGRLSAYYPAFPEGGLARVHFIIGRSGGKTPKVEQATIEAAIRDIVRTWEDALREAAADAGTRCAARRRSPRVSRKAIAAASRRPRRCSMPAGSPGSIAENPIAIDYYRHAGQTPDAGGAEDLPSRQAGRAVAARAGAGEHRLPGHQRAHLRGRRRRTATRSSSTTWSSRTPSRSRSIWPTAASCSRMCSCRSGAREADNDGYNALAQTAGLRSREIGILRAYGRYLQQAGIPQSQDFIAAVLNRYPDIARALFTPVRRPPRSGQARRARLPPSISRRRSRMRWRTCPTSTTTPSSAATST